MGRVSLTKRITNAWHALRGDPGWADRWYEVFPGNMTKAGIRIDQESALTIPTLFAALNFLASTMATLPKVVMRRLPSGGREHALDHPLYDRLHNKVNDEGLSSWQWIFTSINHKYLWGNWYTLRWIKTYRNQQLYPLLPERMVRYDEQRKGYIYRLKSGEPVFIPRDRLLHIPHISMDGVMGKGIIHYARESLGLAKAQEEFAATFFGQGIHPGGFVEVGGTMAEETRTGLQRDFNEKYGGLGRNWKFIFVTGDSKIKEASVDAQKAQALESRQFSVVEVARWMNLPPHILRDLVRATFSNIEQQSLELVIYSLLPLATQIEQAMNIRLFDDEERRTHYIKFELKGLLRGDLEARTKFYTAMLDRGVFNADTVLELEDMNPQPNGLGRVYVLPLNMVNKQYVVGGGVPSLQMEEESGALPAARHRSALTFRQKSIAERRLLTKAWKPVFARAAGRLLKKEIAAVRSAVEETLKERAVTDFSLWLEEFYRDFPSQVKKTVGRTVDKYAEDLLPIALGEIGTEANVSAEYAEFRRRYLDDLAHRHTTTSRRALMATLREAETEGRNEAEALEERLVEWEEKRPAKITMHETVRAEGAFARAAFAAAGVRYLRWVAYGDSCPYCTALDGVIVGIDQTFVAEGEWQPEGADKPFAITGTRRHPPLHAGCDCSIEASI